jgi:hypothetical protein
MAGGLSVGLHAKAADDNRTDVAARDFMAPVGVKTGVLAIFFISRHDQAFREKQAWSEAQPHHRLGGFMRLFG